MNALKIDKAIFYAEAKDYIFLTLGLLVYAASWTVFLLPYEIVTGGVTGMSAIIYYATGFKIENSYLIINLTLLVVALKILGFKFMVKTIYAIVALYFMLKFAQELMPVDGSGHFVKILGEGQEFMSLIVGCCLTGTGNSVPQQQQYWRNGHHRGLRQQVLRHIARPGTHARRHHGYR